MSFFFFPNLCLVAEKNLRKVGVGHVSCCSGFKSSRKEKGSFLEKGLFICFGKRVFFMMYPVWLLRMCKLR